MNVSKIYIDLIVRECAESEEPAKTDSPLQATVDIILQNAPDVDSNGIPDAFEKPESK